MPTFTIDSENNIVAHAEVPAARENLQSFASVKELAKLAADWPAARSVEVWNSFAGVAPFTELKPVKKFKDRKSVLAWFWAAIQRLSRDVAPQASDVAPEQPKSRKSATKPAKCARGAAGCGGAHEQESRSSGDDEACQGRTLAEIVEANGIRGNRY